MNYINNAIELIKAPNYGAIIIAVVAFVFGMIAMCLICKIFGCKGKCKGAKKSFGNRNDKPFEKRKPHPAPADGSVELYVGNLSYDMTEDDVRKEFVKFGEVKSVRLVMNRFNGKSKGFAFVQMPNRAEAEKACKALNDHELMGRKIKCNEAKNLI